MRQPIHSLHLHRWHHLSFEPLPSFPVFPAATLVPLKPILARSSQAGGPGLTFSSGSSFHAEQTSDFFPRPVQPGPRLPPLSVSVLLDGLLGLKHTTLLCTWYFSSPESSSLGSPVAGSLLVCAFPLRLPLMVHCCLSAPLNGYPVGAEPLAGFLHISRVWANYKKKAQETSGREVQGGGTGLGSLCS